MRIIIVVCLGLLLAPVAQAQFSDCTNPGNCEFLDCSGPGGCTDTLFGLGNDPREGPYENTHQISYAARPDGSCSNEDFLRLQGRVRLREQNSCVASATARCPLEIPQIVDDSGILNVNSASVDFGPLGLFRGGGGGFENYAGNLGYREIVGSCTDDAGEACALDSDCPSGTGCLSTCFSDPGTTCSSEDDAACAAGDCVTKIEWDGIGLCTDLTTVCSADADCPEPETCNAGFQWGGSLATCWCCQSELATLCALFVGWAEWPALNCAAPGSDTATTFAAAAPDWVFEGGRSTPFDMEEILVPGQQEGICTGNRNRSCGTKGDFWAGAENDKCIGAPPCPDPIIGDPTQGAEASPCDDVAFGGIAGDTCDLAEQAMRTFNGRNPDGTPDSTACPPGATYRLVGTPNELCALPLDIPEGDPQAGCQLINIGIVGQPDLDCDGTDDTNQGRCMPEGGATCADPADCPPCTDDGQCASGNCINNGDLCPFIGEGNWFLDSNNDDIGDECQCGDGTGDGAITGLDIAAVALCANGAGAPGACDPTIIDATGDNATTAEDVGGIVSVVNGVLSSAELECVRNLDSTQ